MLTSPNRLAYKVFPSGRAGKWYWEVTCCGAIVARGLASTRVRARAHALTAAASYYVEAPSEDDPTPQLEEPRL
jgi:hypothetical protein